LCMCWCFICHRCCKIADTATLQCLGGLLIHVLLWHPKDSRGGSHLQASRVWIRGWPDLSALVNSRTSSAATNANVQKYHEIPVDKWLQP
jgi:hypothetical protein